MSFLDKLKGVLKPKDKSKNNSESTKNMGVNHSEKSEASKPGATGVNAPKKPNTTSSHSGAEKTDGIFRESAPNGQSEEDITRALVLDDLDK